MGSPGLEVFWRVRPPVKKEKVHKTQDEVSAHNSQSRSQGNWCFWAAPDQIGRDTKVTITLWVQSPKAAFLNNFQEKQLWRLWWEKSIWKTVEKYEIGPFWSDCKIAKEDRLQVVVGPWLPLPPLNSANSALLEPDYPSRTQGGDRRE